MDYYKRFMGDYQRDTGDLSLAEHGAYTVLLDHYYSIRKPLPAALDKLYRLCRATTKAEQEAVETVANQFFKVAADGLRHNARADEEIAKWEEFAEENRQKGKLGGRPKKNPDANPAGIPNDNQAGFNNDSSGKPEKTRRVSSGFEKEGDSETRTKPYPDPNPNPEARSLNQSLDAERARATPESTSDEVRLESATVVPLTEVQRMERMVRLQAIYPAGTYRQSEWGYAERELSHREGEGESFAVMLAGVERYRAQCDAKGSTGTQFVMSPHKFFRERLYREPFPLPLSRAEQKLESNIDAARTWMAQAGEAT